MDWDFTQAPHGDIALTGELDLTGTREFTLGLVTESLSTLFGDHYERSAEQGDLSSANILRWMRSRVMEVFCIARASICFPAMKTNRILALSSPRPPFHGDKPSAMKITVVTTWYGRATW
jgi:hypothetical protein